MNETWIGVDLDGTLAEYDNWRGPEHIGAPIESMVARVKKWLAEGQSVKIFTARVSPLTKLAIEGITGPRVEELRAQLAWPIVKWCVTHIGQELPITCIKDFAMVELWDDRAVGLVPNTGNIRKDFE